MTDQSSFMLRKQTLEMRIKEIVQDLDVPEDKAFMYLSYAWLFNKPYSDPDYDIDSVDGGGDKQIDIIRIEEDQDQATIHLVQVKNSAKYEGTVVVQMRDALSWIFERPEEQYSQLANKDLASKIGEVRALLSKHTTRNVDIRMYYIAKGDTERLSPDFLQEVNNTENLYDQGRDFQSFKFQVWGVNELIERLYEIEQEKRKIDVDLPIYAVWNAPSYLVYKTLSLESAVCIVDGVSLAQIVDEYKERLFEENVRTYLGDKKQVNADILKTCSNDAEAEYFWFYNNGVTVTCDKFELAYYATPPYIRIENIQIVNGCQTSMTLRDAMKKGVLSDKTKLLFKVFATRDRNFVDKITFTTNSQNAVSNRDLRSNDEVQRNLEKLFFSRGYFYERKPRMFKSLLKNEKKRIIPNDKCGQALLAVVQHYPATAMAHTNKIWLDTLYKSIYSSRIEEILASYLLYTYCLSRSKELRKDLDGVENSVVKYGNFHLARIIGSLLIGENWRNCSPQKLEQLIELIETKPSQLNESYERSREILKPIVEDLSQKDTTSLINVFKSDKIQQKIDNSLKKEQR